MEDKRFTMCIVVCYLVVNTENCILQRCAFYYFVLFVFFLFVLDCGSEKRTGCLSEKGKEKGCQYVGLVMVWE